jgi:hypothetical protein
MRTDSRPPDELRETTITPHYIPHAEGSVLIAAGRTRVICTASVEDRVPPFLRNTGKGWVTAEYGMLPRATNTRMQREASTGKVGGRTQEIQRLIGRSLRAVTNLPALGERTVWIDCDVISADGGTRTASITGAFVALALALGTLRERDAHDLRKRGEDRVLKLGQDEPDEAGPLAAELRGSLVAEDVERREHGLARRFRHPGLAVEHPAHRRLADANLARNLGQPSCHCRIICKISTSVCGPEQRLRRPIIDKCDGQRHR